MAEAFLKQRAQERFEAESAGLEPGKLNPLVIEVMQEIGIDISQNTTKSVFDLYKQGKRYDYVITVCDESQAQKCPVFPGTTATQRIHWGFDDPASFEGSREEKLERTRSVRDNIKQRIDSWLRSIS
jgi:arsenate reductase